MESITCKLKSVVQIGQANVLFLLELLKPHSSCVRHQHCFLYLKMMGQELLRVRDVEEFHICRGVIKGLKGVVSNKDD